MIVIERVDLGDYVAYTVADKNGKRQYWELMKPEAELAEQERNRLETEVHEAEMGAIIYDSAEEEIMERLGLVKNPPQRLDWVETDEWLDQPVTIEPPKMKAPDVQPKKVYYERSPVQIWNLNYCDYVQLGLNKFILVDTETREVIAIRQCYQNAKQARSELLG
jgi:hypothetical protein